ncbi:hypothetical protein JCM10212_004371 [Sporobolomyces blumeae]
MGDHLVPPTSDDPLHLDHPDPVDHVRSRPRTLAASTSRSCTPLATTTSRTSSGVRDSPAHRANPRPKPRHSFVLEFPARSTAATARPVARPRSSLAGGASDSHRPSSSTASTSSSAMSHSKLSNGQGSSSIRNGDVKGKGKEIEVEEDEPLLRVLKIQKSAGMEDQYRVLLREGGKQVLRSHSQLSQTAPRVLAEFLSTLSASPTPTPVASSDDVDDDDDSDVILVEPKPKAQAPGRSNRSRTVEDQTDENEDEDEDEDGSEGNGDDDFSDEAEETEQDTDASGDYAIHSSDDDDDDDVSGRTRRRKLGRVEKPRREGTRHSNREGRKQVDYRLDAGFDLDVDEEGEGEGHDSGPSRGEGIATRRSRRRSSSTTAVGSATDEDELSIQVGERTSKGKGKARELITLTSDEEGGGATSEASSETRSSNAVSNATLVGKEGRMQDAHYSTCWKCKKPPTSVVLRDHRERAAKKKKGGRKKRKNADMYDSEEELAMDRKLGAWVECDCCVSAFHFGCLTAPLQKSLKLGIDRANAKQADSASTLSAMTSRESSTTSSTKGSSKVLLDPDETLKIDKCTSCVKQYGTWCFGCRQSGKKVTDFERADLEARKQVQKDSDDPAAQEELKPGLLFRCLTCKRPAHYGCLDKAEFDDAETTFANHTFSYLRDGVCHDCYRFDSDWNVRVDVILGWWETGTDSGTEANARRAPKSGGFVMPDEKDPTSRAMYLVKWQDHSYVDTHNVPHSWLAARYAAKLAHFLTHGSTVNFNQSTEGDDLDPDEDADPDRTARQKAIASRTAPKPDPEIEKQIPAAWKTVDRVLDVQFLSPATGNLIGLDRFKARPKDDEESVKLVAKAYVKWGGLPYGQSTWSTPPQADEPGFAAYFKAYQRFLVASDAKMAIPPLTPLALEKLRKPEPGTRPVFTEQPEIVKNGTLKDFQVEGLNFLLDHWWVRKGCILADEMGLGKTCQIICFIAYLSSRNEKPRPCLVVVPNSLVQNWLREFEHWAPQLRVVPYSAHSADHKIIEDYELFTRTNALKANVVIATYEAVETRKTVFSRVSWWECLVVDEGQRLKGGPKGKLWKATEILSVGTKILLTGTPLNNNLTELYNLLAFLDPLRFDDVAAIVESHKDLTADDIEAVRADLRPYMLRRTKDQVLNLPPLGDFVVPVTLTTLQRQMYRGVLEKNSEAIQSLVQIAAGQKVKSKPASTPNILMNLRKICNHPYLASPELDSGTNDKSLGFRQLTDASAKLLVLEKILPKLKAQGHRVLIFSQFKIALNVIEAFLNGLGLRWLRLDGETQQLDRQRDVDKFQAPDSPYFAYLLSTRAGGVGLTLTAADVVIIFDQDWNPFQDAQAISRAHRIGQTRPVRVFKLVVKDTCEEKILSAGRKKQGLEHLIIQKIDAKDEETADLASALQWGAQAIFEDEEKVEQIRYTEDEIDELLSKTADPLSEAAKAAAGAFSTAQVWSSTTKGLVDAGAEQDDKPEEDAGFWDRLVAEQVQAKQEIAKKEETENKGRARRARKAVDYKIGAPSPDKALANKKGKPRSPTPTSPVTSDDDYRQKPEGELEDSEEASAAGLDEDERDLLNDGRVKPKRKRARPLPVPPVPDVHQVAQPVYAHGPNGAAPVQTAAYPYQAMYSPYEMSDGLAGSSTNDRGPVVDRGSSAFLNAQAYRNMVPASGAAPPMHFRQPHHALSTTSKSAVSNTSAQAPAAEAEQKLQRKLARRRKQIWPLMAAAIEFTDDRLKVVLQQAYDCKDAVRQKELIHQATTMLGTLADARDHAARDRAPPAPAAHLARSQAPPRPAHPVYAPYPVPSVLHPVAHPLSQSAQQPVLYPPTYPIQLARPAQPAPHPHTAQPHLVPPDPSLRVPVSSAPHVESFASRAPALEKRPTTSDAKHPDAKRPRLSAPSLSTPKPAFSYKAKAKTKSSPPDVKPSASAFRPFSYPTASASMSSNGAVGPSGSGKKPVEIIVIDDSDEQ